MKKMQKMRKIAAVCLIAAVMCASLTGFYGCGTKDPDDKGATLLMYLGGDPSNLNLDPAKMIYSSEAVKFMGLIFEGMMTMDEDGKLQKGMCKKYTVIENIAENEEDSTYKIQFEIKDTKWSDGKPVTADDFVYAWKRILEPEFSSPAAPLLYDIKNARAVKAGDMTVDDLGVVALDEKLLEVTFTHKINYDKFLENLASIALVPLRSDTIDPAPEEWAKKPLTLLTNGPFTIKQMEYNKGTSIERSTYYLLAGKKGEDIMKYVKPYKIVLDFSRNLNQITDAYAADDYIFYLGNVPTEKYSEYSGKAVTKDLLSTYSYHFNVNTANGLFKKAEVRKALSIALDRNHIAELVSLGVKPATGIVPTGIIDEKSTGEDFRKVGGDLINPAGDLAGAKSLLQSAGVSSGSFELKVRDTDTEKAVAEYAKEIWGQLGFTVTVTPMRGTQYSDDIFNANYDVMGYDDQAIGVDAYSVLAPFAKAFCGGKITFLNEGESEVTPYITGFQDDAYDALIEDIYVTDNDNAARTQKLHDAEKALIELSPVAPLYFNTNINITEKISGLSYSKFGYTVFTKANLKDYHQYETTAETTAAPAASE